MRRPRVILFEDGVDVDNPLKRFFDARGCETTIVSSGDVCPFYGNTPSDDAGSLICCDVAVIVHQGPIRDTAHAAEPPFHHGCVMRARHKGVIAPMLTMEQRMVVEAAGAAAFPAPLDMDLFEPWFTGCLEGMDADTPPIVMRKELRRSCAPAAKVQFRVLPGDAVNEARALNLSAGGICMRTAADLKVRQVVHLWSEQLLLAEDAEVRWSRRAGDGTQLAGLTFCVL